MFLQLSHGELVMKTSNKQKGWGTLCLLVMMLMISACSEQKRSQLTERATESGLDQTQQFDYFSEECVSGYRSGIVNGQDVKQTDADANRSILLIWEDDKGQQSICSSTLVDQQTLLTAAHCVKNAVKMQAVFYTDITCSSGYKRSEHTIMVDKTAYHPDFKFDLKSNDVLDENPDLALVHLVRSAPAHFPIFQITTKPEELTSDLYLYGYGITGTFKQDSMMLRKGKVLRKDLDGEDNSFFINNNLFFGQKNSPGLCSGDSGGAILMDDNGEYVIASVNSEVFTDQSDLSGDLCNNGAKTVLVYPYLDSWIIPTMAAWNAAPKIKNPNPN